MGLMNFNYFIIFMYMAKKLNTTTFIERAKQVHENKYDYSLSEYSKAKVKLKIQCPEHGIFEQTPDNHLRLKAGCPTCGGSKTLTKEEFSQKSNKIHSGVYDYSNVSYKNNQTKVKIKCSKHGLFFQRPADHLNGLGCPKCGVEKMAKSKLSNTEDFIIKTRKVHGDTFDYSEVDYKKSRHKIKIKCPKHGVFFQTPNEHLMGAGCPVCIESKGEKLIRRFLESHLINFTPQKRFPDCKDKRTLPFDFFLPDYNLCIEYDGIQHFDKNHKYYSKDRERKDGIKTDYCKQEGKPDLLRISYLQKRNIESILKKVIS